MRTLHPNRPAPSILKRASGPMWRNTYPQPERSFTVPAPRVALTVQSDGGTYPTPATDRHCLVHYKPRFHAVRMVTRIKRALIARPIEGSISGSFLVAVQDRMIARFNAR